MNSPQINLEKNPTKFFQIFSPNVEIETKLIANAATETTKIVETLKLTAKEVNANPMTVE